MNTRPGPVEISDGLLTADRRTVWNPGVTYGGGGIPDRAEVCASLAPSGADDTAAIQDALDACAAGQVVELAAGTFNISGPGLELRASHITLRGAGPGQPGSGEGGTRLVKADRDDNAAGAILYVGNNAAEFASSHDLAADGVKGAHTVTLADDPGLALGEYVLIDHDTTNDPDVVWNEFHGPPGDGSRRWFARQDRSLSQIVEITAVDGPTVTFATPLHWTFRTDYQAQLSRYGDGDGNVRPFVEWAGIEDVYLYGGMEGDFHGNLAISACAYCWVRNVESNYNIGTAIGFYGTYRSELRDSYVHSTADPNPGGGGYLFGISNGGSDNLAENNIFWQGNKMLVMRASGGGNVFAYNYLDDGYGSYYPDIVEVGLNAGHYTTPHMELLEGNQAWNADGDSYWGNSLAITLFRNHLTGTRRDVAGLGLEDRLNRRIAALNQYHYGYNFVGNVLGEPDMALVADQRRFVYELSAEDVEVVPVWQLGYVGEDPGQPYDPKVAETTLRHGNFDFVTGEQHWDDAVATRDLPPSLYLTDKPEFFGDLPWPWVDPAAGTTADLPARVRFDRIHGL
ncbi:MAG TPA: hypothetical protein VNQ73_12475 [Ilumatobacter sp.]|nr:hypothetical protein [Ilumatobacter sp.]